MEYVLPCKTYRVFDLGGERTIVTHGGLSFSRVVDKDISNVGYRYLGLIHGQSGMTTTLRITSERLVLHYWHCPEDGGEAIEQISY